MIRATVSATVSANLSAAVGATLQQSAQHCSGQSCRQCNSRLDPIAQSSVALRALSRHHACGHMSCARTHPLQGLSPHRMPVTIYTNKFTKCRLAGFMYVIVAHMGPAPLCHGAPLGRPVRPCTPMPSCAALCRPVAMCRRAAVRRACTPIPSLPLYPAPLCA